jgi:hypothetical protein
MRMHRMTSWAATVLVVLASGCGKGGAPAPQSSALESLEAVTAPVSGTVAAQGSGASSSADLARMERKIVRTAGLSILAADPSDAERRAMTIVEELGGYVASSDHADSNDADDATEAVSMVLRVPSERFSVALPKLRAVGSRSLREHVSSEDVTEEFIDVNARTVSQKALEGQFLEILKQSKTVKDALEVNTRLAEVRETIEKLEGRMQFLERQTSLSTIKLGIVHRAPLVSASRFGFVESLKQAGSDVLNVSATIVHAVIRILGFVVPIFILLVLPALVFVRSALRSRRRRLSQV